MNVRLTSRHVYNTLWVDHRLHVVCDRFMRIFLVHQLMNDNFSPENERGTDVRDDESASCLLSARRGPLKSSEWHLAPYAYETKPAHIGIRP